MGFDVTLMNEYIGEQKLGLLQMMTTPLEGVMAGVTEYDGFKAGTKEQWTIVTSNTVFNDGTCSESSAGGFAFTPKLVEIGKYGVNETLCFSDLNPTWIRNRMKKGSYDTLDNDLNRMLAVMKAEDIRTKLANEFWNASKLSGDRIDGILTQLRDNISTLVIDGNPDGLTAFGTNVGDILAVFDKQIELLPDNVLFSGQTVYMHTSTSLFKRLINDMRKENNYHFTGEWSNMMIDYPNYPNVKIVGNVAFKQDVIVSTYEGNLGVLQDSVDDPYRAYGVDPKGFDKAELYARFGFGAGIAFDELVVFFELAPVVPIS
jgi:hypothetical protein